MLRRAASWLATRGDRPVVDDAATVRRRYRSARWTTCFAQRESSIIVAAAW